MRRLLLLAFDGPARRPRRAPAAAVGALAVLALAGCGDDDGGDAAGGACGPDRREALDPATGAHVLGDTAAEYRTDPPTSGPHQPGALLSGVLDEPVSRPAQVGSLEAGGVLVQHRDLGPAELAEVEALATDGVAVAPNADLPDRVVATAWLHKRTCSGVDAAALREFVEAHLGEGPGADG